MTVSLKKSVPRQPTTNQPMANVFINMEVRDARASTQAAQTWTAGFGLAKDTNE